MFCKYVYILFRESGFKILLLVYKCRGIKDGNIYLIYFFKFIVKNRIMKKIKCLFIFFISLFILFKE